MRLTEQQIRGLAQVIAPHFQTTQQRQTVLDSVFGTQPNLVASVPIEDSSAIHFTANLITTLQAVENQNSSAESGLQHLLKTLQSESTEDTFSTALQAYIDILYAPNLTQAISVSPSGSASTSSAAKKHRRRSPIKSALKKLNKRVRWQLVIVVILMALIIPSATVSVLAADSYARVQDSLASLERVMTAFQQQGLTGVTQADFDRLQAAVNNFVDNLRQAQQQSGLIKRFSFLKPDLRATFDLLDAAQQTALAAQGMLEGLQPVAFFAFKGPQDSAVAQISSGERIVQLVQIGQGRFITANDQLDAAQNLLDKLGSSDISPNLLLLLGKLTQYHSMLKDADQLLLTAPDTMSAIFGMTDPQNYLVLSANSDELRPSGGYISTYGYLRVRHFRIADYGYSPTTTVSPNPPPESMADQLKIPDWWLHFPKPIYSAFDESWYADFPSTAKMAAWFYEQGNNPRLPLSGVIGIDLIGFQEILDGLGSVSVPEYNVVVTSKNFRDEIYRIRAESGQHKQFLVAAFEEIFSQWQTIDTKHSAQLLNATLRALREKHIMIYFTDPKLNKIMDTLQWSGAQRAGSYDYLMVADANLGNKSNSSVTRDITYDVAIGTDSSVQHRTEVNYDYSASVADKDPAVKPEHYGNQKDYYNLMQVFVPKDSKVTDTSNLQSPLQIGVGDNLTILVTNVKVNFDSSERFQFSYSTAGLIEQLGPYHRYRLLLQKQPGTSGDNVSIQVKLPVGSRMINASPIPATTYTVDNPILEFRVQLVTDQWIDIVYQ